MEVPTSGTDVELVIEQDDRTRTLKGTVVSQYGVSGKATVQLMQGDVKVSFFEDGMGDIIDLEAGSRTHCTVQEVN